MSVAVLVAVGVMWAVTGVTAPSSVAGFVRRALALPLTRMVAAVLFRKRGGMSGVQVVQR